MITIEVRAERCCYWDRHSWETKQSRMAALFTTGKSQKQSKCPSTDEWIKKRWHIYTMEYYSAIKRNEVGSFVILWMNLESVIQCEVCQKEKNKYHKLTHVCGKWYIQKNGADETICRTQLETQKQVTDMRWTWGWMVVG